MREEQSTSTPRSGPYSEYSVVRTRVPKQDDKRRQVATGSEGVIAHVHQTKDGQSPGYIVEVVIADERGMQSEAHIFDALHDDLELVQMW